MGAWGSGPLENDGAWDFVDQFLSWPIDERPARVLNALDSAARADVLDVDAAAGAVVGALIVAAARNPTNVSDLWPRLVARANSVREVDSFPGLVETLRVL